jgi:hypothetical protein
MVVWSGGQQIRVDFDMPLPVSRTSHPRGGECMNLRPLHRANAAVADGETCKSENSVWQP